MKKILRITAFCLMAVLVLSCSKQEEKEVDTANAAADYSAPSKLISVEEAKAMQDRYVNTRFNFVTQGLGHQDTREFWWSLDDLEAYMRYVREKSKEQGVETPGIRFYLGAYEPGHKNGTTTLFLVPTKEDSSSGKAMTSETQVNNYEIDPMNESNGGVPPTVY